ncbi:MAG: DUF6020 family protein [Butyrivibrio sp.]|nr:DUF6020 family protein [Muribaculum sp.]MCM1552408.1 DUF6020 family protein [Butyrivibrio sp.]
MSKEKGKKIGIAALLSLTLTLMQVSGWQISMKYGTSVHQSALLQGIGVLEAWQCVLLGIVEFCLLGFVIYTGFSWLEKRKVAENAVFPELPKYFWVGVGAVLFVIYMAVLVGCYPGFYNYDVGNQIPQVLYAEVPYNAHHPLLHTLIEGGIIALGYRIYPEDLSFGIFLYCAFQMLVCAACFAYSLRFLYRMTKKRWLTIIAFGFYAFCPSVVMCAMSTTKDILCYVLLLLSVLKIYEIYGDMNVYTSDTEQPAPGRRLEHVRPWLAAAVPMVLSCMFRNNVVYGVIVFGILACILVRRNRRAQIIFYAGVVCSYLVLNQGLIYVTNAAPASVIEALSVPLQQIARLYVEKGEEAFTDQELELLYSLADPELFTVYDPFISDNIKYVFRCHIDVMMERKWEFARLWVQKGLEYPGVYLDSFMDNTYQAWYPWTVVIEGDGYRRYFLVPDWRETDGKPLLPALYDFYRKLNDEFSYAGIPFLRLLFTTGTMFWVALIAWFYGLWRKDRGILAAMGLTLLVCATSLCGPVADVRYYLILFYMMPICMGFLCPQMSRTAVSAAKETFLECGD